MQPAAQDNSTAAAPSFLVWQFKYWFQLSIDHSSRLKIYYTCSHNNAHIPFTIKHFIDYLPLHAAITIINNNNKNIIKLMQY